MKAHYALIGLTALMLAGCDDDDDNSPAPKPEPRATAEFTVTISNLTAAQPLSPLAAYLHDGSASGWSFGQAASVGLEQLAEAGDGSEWLAMAKSQGAYYSASGDGIVGPGASDSVTLTVYADQLSDIKLTGAGMLVNTNDAFAGINNLDLSGLAVGDSLTINLPVYDAGTEGNSELAATIPGPAGGGAGFDAMRDDVDYVARHPGVVGNQDGYGESALDGTHKFDAPVARLSVIRQQ